jgi:hypothetical protein
VGAVEASYFLPFVYQQRELEFVLVDEFFMAFGGARVDAVNYGILRLHARPVVAEVAYLLGSAGGIVSRVEDQDDVLAAHLCEVDQVSVLIFEFKWGRSSAYLERIAPEPAELKHRIDHPLPR